MRGYIDLCRRSGICDHRGTSLHDAKRMFAQHSGSTLGLGRSFARRPMFSPPVKDPTAQLKPGTATVTLCRHTAQLFLECFVLVFVCRVDSGMLFYYNSFCSFIVLRQAARWISLDLPGRFVSSQVCLPSYPCTRPRFQWLSRSALLLALDVH